MTSTGILDLLKLLWAGPGALFWPGLAWTLDALRDLGGVSAGLLAVAFLAVPVGLAFGLQRRLNAILAGQPEERIGLWAYLKLELWHSVPALPLWPFRLLAAAVRGLGRLARRLGRRSPAAATGEPRPLDAPAPPPPPPLVVASLGPGFLLAGLATAAVYVLARLADPFLRAQLGLSQGLSAWQYLFLGRRAELAWYLPLDRYPFLAGLLSLLAWVLVWTLLGIALRAFYQRQLGRNLAADREREDILPLWRRWCGATALAAPARSYLEWAAWPVAAAVPLLAWAWLSLGGDPYRVRSSEMAVASVLWTSWALHLLLRGLERVPAVTEEPASPPEAQANGWPEVLAHLQTEREVAPPEPWEERAAEPLLFSEADPRTAAILSPLATDLLPAPRKLTPMQRQVLTQLAFQGFVHVDPPVALEHLTLEESAAEILQDRSDQRVRHQVVLAPEGQGKTTLALLAAANHALVHTRGTLVVVRGEEEAAALADRFRRVIEPSPLRWNVRVRHTGGDLMNDLSQGIIPDVVVCSLRDLALTVLDRADSFAPFLRNVGLIVVDNVEAFAGPVEVHAQLAFRRLTLRLSELLGLRELGDRKEKGSPQMLILGGDSMEETGQWAKSLCGVDAVVRSFSRSARETRERETAELAATGITVRRGSEEEALPLHHLFRLRDFRAGEKDLLGLEDLVAACERLAVPWHYRLCGDGRRDLGRGPLLLREEPSYYAEAPEDACVVILEGTWSEVRREWRRLVRAGARFSRFRRSGDEAGPVRHAGGAAETIAFVTLADPDVEMAFTHLDAGFTLAPALGSLPRPVLRPPTGQAVEPHLAADLVQHWTEVEDVLRVFGAATAPTLSRLAHEGLLLCEPRSDVDDRTNEYVEQVYVRALARALRSADDDEAHPEVQGLLPSKVAQVETASTDTAVLRDRTNLLDLGVADRAGAHFIYYPGRIFKDARGTFVVVGREGDGILVEPLLSDEVSSPRRQLRVRSLRGEEEASRLLEAAGGGFPEPHRVLLGRHPFLLALEPVEVRVEHIATYRLGPVHCEVRQRTLLDPEARERYREASLVTVALVLIPNPESSEEAAGPRLTLGGSRLLAAALRALLPALYRGAAESLQVALHGDALYLFDAEHGGNGASRAIYRDGIEPILRLARLLVERVLSPVRLRALFDEWGDESEIVAESRGEETLVEAGEEARQDLLAWLSSRLRPEGGPEGWHGPGEALGGAELWEGDLFDLGRCWYTRDGSLSDLVWARHRWRLPGRGEATLDIGFDRSTQAGSRSLARLGADELERRSGALPAPLPVRFLDDGGTEPRTSEIPDPDRLRLLHLQAGAAATHAAPALVPLAGLLRERSAAESQLALTRFLGGFVRAIPAARGEGADPFRSPVDTLLQRLGDDRARSLLLASLLRSCGIGAGVFVHQEGRGAMAAVALPEPLGGDAFSHLEAFREAAGLSALPSLWAELPSDGGTHLFVPIPVSMGDVGTLPLDRPETWAFLPLPLPEYGEPLE
ncbi:MAG TPA: DEAD/DEAH box helicase [Thermoanaerobaculia bacterium]|nr:DEAD/DEAH box helicase [Thermoanaerobaculia bacterium]